jgi:hypothetical protein
MSSVLFTSLTLILLQVYICIVAGITFPMPLLELILELLFEFLLFLLILVVFVFFTFAAILIYINIVIVAFFTSPQVGLVVTFK